MSHARPLEVAADTYFWKPGTAWFRALELHTHGVAGALLRGPTLDLGCGDGRVAAMLARLGRVGGSLFGLDPALPRLGEARGRTPHRALVGAEGGHLPFRDASFASVLCNGVLCSIAGGPGHTLAEIHRVLQPGGTVVATFPTDRFLSVLLWPRLLDFWPRARSVYENRMNRRQQHFTTASRDDWTLRFEERGLAVERSACFLSPHGGGLWNLLAMHVFRFFGLLKLVPSSPPASLTRSALTRLLRTPFHREQGRSGEGYMLVVARRATEETAS